MVTIKRESATRAFSLIMVLTILISTLPFASSATTGQTDVPGKIYEFGKDSHYEFADSEYSDASESNTYESIRILKKGDLLDDKSERRSREIP